MPFFYCHANWFVGDENNRNLNNLFQKWFCSPSKVPISTRIILRNTIKRPRMFNQLLLTQNLKSSASSLICWSLKYCDILLLSLVDIWPSMIWEIFYQLVSVHIYLDSDWSPLPSSPNTAQWCSEALGRIWPHEQRKPGR